MKTEEIRDLNLDEILDKVEGLRKDHFNMRLTAKTGKLEKSHRMREVRRVIARFLTIQHEIRRSQTPAEGSVSTPPAPKKVKPKQVEKPKAKPKVEAKIKEEKQEEKSKKGFLSKLRRKKS